MSEVSNTLGIGRWTLPDELKHPFHPINLAKAAHLEHIGACDKRATPRVSCTSRTGGVGAVRAVQASSSPLTNLLSWGQETQPLNPGNVRTDNQEKTLACRRGGELKTGLRGIYLTPDYRIMAPFARGGRERTPGSNTTMLSTSLTLEQTLEHFATLGNLPDWFMAGVEQHTDAVPTLPFDDFPIPHLGPQLHWHRAGQQLAPVAHELGRALGVAQAVLAVALASERESFVLCLWEIGALLGISGDYVGRLLKRHKHALRRVAFWGNAFTTLEGRSFNAGTLWRVDLERDFSEGLLRRKRAVPGHPDLFTVLRRDLLGDIYLGHTEEALSHLSRPNRRGGPGGITDVVVTPEGERFSLLEHIISRAVAEPRITQTGVSTVHDVLEAVSRKIGASMGEKLGWVRTLAGHLASLLGGSRDLLGWYRVAWDAVNLQLPSILRDVLEEVLVRGADALLRNRSAVILVGLRDRGWYAALKERVQGG